MSKLPVGKFAELIHALSSPIEVDGIWYNIIHPEILAYEKVGDPEHVLKIAMYVENDHVEVFALDNKTHATDSSKPTFHVKTVEELKQAFRDLAKNFS